MNDETRKALDKIFARGNEGDIRPIGASKILHSNIGSLFTGKFEVYGSTLKLFRKLYDDAITADDAAKLDAQRDAEGTAIAKAADAQREADAKQKAADDAKNSGDE